MKTLVFALLALVAGPVPAAQRPNIVVVFIDDMGAKLLPLTLKPGDKEPGRIWQDAERLGGPVTWKQRSEITAGFVDAAIPFIDRAAGAGKPFYLNLWPDDVHSPFWPPVDRWADGKRGLYLSVLREMDRQLGRLFDHLRKSPELRDNTLVLVCSDNGPEPGAGSAGPFRGTKGMLYEGGIRSPLPDLAVREGKWKLLCDYDGSRPELYDLDGDSGESRNLAADEADQVKRLTGAAITWHRALPADGPAAGEGRK